MQFIQVEKKNFFIRINQYTGEGDKFRLTEAHSISTEIGIKQVN